MYGCASVHTACMCRFVILSSLCLVMSGLVCVRGGRLHVFFLDCDEWLYVDCVCFVGSPLSFRR